MGIFYWKKLEADWKRTWLKLDLKRTKSGLKEEVCINLENSYNLVQPIPNGCFNAYELKVNKDIFLYQEKVKLIYNSREFLNSSMAY